MPQFYPDGPAAVSLHAIEESGGLNTPAQENFDTPALQGTMQQLLSENLGKYVIADFLVGVSSIVRRVGILYSVGRGFVVLYLDEYKAFEVCDIFSLKFVTFFPPGSEPPLEELNSSGSVSGLLTPGGAGGLLAPGGVGGVLGMGSARGQTGDFGRASPAGSGNNGMNRTGSASGCRTLGQR